MKGLCLLASALAVATATATATAAGPNCHCLPGDDCWPSISQWNALNSSVAGRLIATVPIGAPCHEPGFDALACAQLQQGWHQPQTHYGSSSSVMQTFFANQSCDPFTAPARPCQLGNYVRYAVNVSSSEHVVAAVNFARENNVRFVIRNTGHDYFGRSTGAGALAVWTHHLNDIQYTDWSDATYAGPAFTLGSGVMGSQLLQAAAARRLVVVTGSCPTVGVAGGYTQGGGHSALSTSFGLAADQTLSFDVVTAAGSRVTASPSSNPDLYYALSGGGAGNYAVVLAMTIKAYPDAPVAGAQLQFLAANTTVDRFQRALERFHALLPGMLDAGATVIYTVTADAFVISPLTAYNKSAAADAKAILAPFVTALADLHIPHQAKYSHHAGYYPHYNQYMGPLPNGNLDVGSLQYGGRLIPRAVLDDPGRVANLSATVHDLVASRVVVVGVALDVSSGSGSGNAGSGGGGGGGANGAHPAWRTAAITMQIGTAWNESAPWTTMLAGQHRMTHDFVPALESASPGGAAYQNEADFRQRNWQQTFFGESYGRLLRVKRRWDPQGFFYALKGVGSEGWRVGEGGRMCRVDMDMDMDMDMERERETGCG